MEPVSIEFLVKFDVGCGDDEPTISMPMVSSIAFCLNRCSLSARKAVRRLR